MGRSNQGKQRKPTALPLSQSMARVWFQIIRPGSSAEIYLALAPETHAPLAFTIFLVQWDKEMKELRSPCAKQQKWSPLPGSSPENTVRVSGVSPLPYKGTKISWIAYCSSVALNAGTVLAGHKRDYRLPSLSHKNYVRFQGRAPTAGRCSAGNKALGVRGCSQAHRFSWAMPAGLGGLFNTKETPTKCPPELFFYGKAALTAGSQQTSFI